MKKINLLLLTLAVFSGLISTVFAATCPKPDFVQWDGQTWSALVPAVKGGNNQELWTQATIGSNNNRMKLYNQHHSAHNKSIGFVSAAAQSSSNNAYNNLICGYAEQEYNNSSHKLGDVQIALQPPQDIYSSISNLPKGNLSSPIWALTATAVSFGKISQAQADDLRGRDWVCGTSISACSFSDASVSIQPFSN